MPVKIIEVETGCVRTAAGGMLRCSALGSCVAVVAFDPVSGAGGIAHIMLPGAAPANARNRNRYARQGVAALLRGLARRGGVRQRLQVCLAGGGNVLNRPDDVLCPDIIRSVKKYLAASGVRAGCSSLGGILRRSITLDTACGEVVCTVGDGCPSILWSDVSSDNRAAIRGRNMNPVTSGIQA